MDGDEFRAVTKRAFHLDLPDHLAHTFHHGVTRKNRRSDARDLGDRLTVADELEDFGGDQRNRFRVIQFQAARAPLSGELTGAEDDELVDFAWSQVHGKPSGVGPAERTGRFDVWYWPGGSRRAVASSGRRPRNPRETNGSAMRLSCLACYATGARDCAPVAWNQNPANPWGLL